MINVSQKQGTAKQLLPTVSEENSATEFTLLSPGALHAQCDQRDKEIKKQTKQFSPQACGLIPISKTQLKHSSSLTCTGSACL